MTQFPVSKRTFLKSGLALGAVALTGNRAFAQGTAVTFRMASTLPADPVNSAHFVWYERFAGNVDHYEDPENSFLDSVIDRRFGIPITLSVLMIAIGAILLIPRLQT